MKIHITETVLRDAAQSLIATRMPFEDFEKALELLDKAGYYSLECWGGATFDSCLRYLSEDPWERLKKIKAKVKNTKLQMLLRGQNLLGYKHYSDETVKMFVKKSVENGIDIVRIFDALNDLDNMRVAVAACLEAGGHAQGCLCYTISPIHTLEKFVALAREIEAMGCQSICIKDMAGIISPKEAFDMVSAIKKAIKIPVVVHTHATTGLGSMSYLKAAEAGADAIDCASSAFSGGTAQPSTQTMVYALEQFGFETGTDSVVLKEINDFFTPVAEKFIKSGALDPFVLQTKTDALVYQVPGGMLSNLIAQLKAQNAMDKLPQVLEETPRVRADLGYPPLVTPLSQMVGVQATVNVLTGERYKNIGKEIKAYIRGEYGKAPGEIDKALAERVLAGEEKLSCRFAETLAPEFATAKSFLGALATCDEDVLSYILFPEQAMGYFKQREDKKVLRFSYSIQEVK